MLAKTDYRAGPSLPRAVAALPWMSQTPSLRCSVGDEYQTRSDGGPDDRKGINQSRAHSTGLVTDLEMGQLRIRGSEEIPSEVAKGTGGKRTAILLYRF